MYTSLFVYSCLRKTQSLVISRICKRNLATSKRPLKMTKAEVWVLKSKRYRCKRKKDGNIWKTYKTNISKKDLAIVLIVHLTSFQKKLKLYQLCFSESKPCFETAKSHCKALCSWWHRKKCKYKQAELSRDKNLNLLSMWTFF